MILTKFDSGKVIIVRYKENMDPADHWALENKFLVQNRLCPNMSLIKSFYQCYCTQSGCNMPYLLHCTWGVHTSIYRRHILCTNNHLTSSHQTWTFPAFGFQTWSLRKPFKQQRKHERGPAQRRFIHIHAPWHCPPEGTTTHDDTLLMGGYSALPNIQSFSLATFLPCYRR